MNIFLYEFKSKIKKIIFFFIFFWRGSVGAKFVVVVFCFVFFWGGGD